MLAKCGAIINEAQTECDGKYPFEGPVRLQCIQGPQ
jgi:hypothetical protein